MSCSQCPYLLPPLTSSDALQLMDSVLLCCLICPLPLYLPASILPFHLWLLDFMLSLHFTVPPLLFLSCVGLSLVYSRVLSHFYSPSILPALTLIFSLLQFLSFIFACTLSILLTTMNKTPKVHRLSSLSLSAKIGSKRGGITMPSLHSTCYAWLVSVWNWTIAGFSIKLRFSSKI